MPKLPKIKVTSFLSEETGGQDCHTSLRLESIMMTARRQAMKRAVLRAGAGTVPA